MTLAGVRTMLPAGVEGRAVYYKRFRMELDLISIPPEPELPSGYFWVPWSEDLLECHAEVKFRSFFNEVDAIVFPSLGSRVGCSHLMHEIRWKPGFRPEATWLAACGDDFCGTVQGVRERSGIGAIQNLGVVLQHRGRGVGRALLLKALHGFRQTGLQMAFLEVTAENHAAIRLYREVGFRCRKTTYKEVKKGDSWFEGLQECGPQLGGFI
jgi:ribosomal protein S18 acetylase RimI-like enzyme